MWYHIHVILCLCDLHASQWVAGTQVFRNGDRSPVPTYANQTSVSGDRSRSEIEPTLSRYGEDSFICGTRGSTAAVQFKVNGRRILFRLELPDPDSREYTHSSTGRLRRSVEQAFEAWEQACRQRWRALVLIVKAKLEAVEAGISSFELEFLTYTVLPGGRTVGGWALPQIARAYETGQMPPLPPMLPS